MTSEQDLLLDIQQSAPQIVMLGEVHKSETAFRKLVLRLLPELKKQGYSVLGLELLPALELDFREFCDGRTTFQQLSKTLHAKENLSFDSDLCSSIKEWCCCQGELVFINTNDPKRKGLTNLCGRDEYMFQRILNVADKRVVLLVGEAHTYVRPKKEIQQGLAEVIDGLDLKARLKQRHPNLSAEEEQLRLTKEAMKYVFLSAAEKLVGKGVTVYSATEFWVVEDSSQTKSYPSGLQLRDELVKEIADARLFRYITGGYGPLATELVKQTVSYGPDQLNAIFFDHTDPYADQLQEMSEMFKRYKRTK